MTPNYTLTQNDLPPPLRAKLTDASGSAVNLTGGTVRFHLTPIIGGPPIIADGTAAILNAPGTDGSVQYTWGTADTTAVGDYWGEFQVSWPGTVLSFPTDPKLLVRIVPEAA